MLKTGILNPQILSLLARVRHTNLLVIADRGFPSWTMMETVDISLVDDVPKVLQVFEALKANFVIGNIFMAEEFNRENLPEVKQALMRSCGEIPLLFESHGNLKGRVPQAIGIIRTGDTTQYANMIIQSA